MCVVYSVSKGLLIPLVLLVLVGVPGAACASKDVSAPGGQGTPAPTPASAASLTRTDGGQGGVTAEATWVTPSHLLQMPQGILKDYPTGGFTFIHLKLDTHSVDLEPYDLTSLSALSDGSDRFMSAAAWVAIKESSHHREGVLVFPGQSNEGWRSKRGVAELRLSRVGGVSERILRWEF